MAAQRTPKRDHPEHMCYQFKEWTACYLDWGECFWMAEAVPGDEYRLLYAYEDCYFVDGFKPRNDMKRP